MAYRWNGLVPRIVPRYFNIPKDSPPPIWIAMFAFRLPKITALAPVFFGSITVAGMPASASSQHVPTVQYTVAQAEMGKEVFRQSCALCHEPDLAGGDQAPPLSGAFSCPRRRWCRLRIKRSRAPPLGGARLPNPVFGNPEHLARSMAKCANWSIRSLEIQKI